MSAIEQHFMATADAVGFAQRDIQPVLGQLHGWLAGLVQSLDDGRLGYAGLSSSHALAQQAQGINAELDDSKLEWTEQWAALQPAQSLAQSFEGKVMLLVFGKFNAGKSSLCNFLADRFRAHGHRMQYFHLEGGQLRETEERFHEGATETTARLQGVCLGEKLVLLDTPGLHSATDENAALTQRFIDSADAVLWLTSSTSPGQVQELDELARELYRGKPLLPIVTRSDFVEEDEIDGVIVTCLRNKTAANRALQEGDVLARAADKLRMLAVDPVQLKAAVSVSAYMARHQEHIGDAMAEAGFDRLYSALLEIVAPALAYKQRKPAEMLLHHLDEQVLGRLQRRTLVALEELAQSLQSEIDSMSARQARLVQMAWREVIPELATLLEQHAAQRDVEAVCAELALMTITAFERQGKLHLKDYALPAARSAHIVLPVGVAYEIAAQAGAEAEDDDAAVGYERLYSSLSHAVRELLTEVSGKAIAACGKVLEQLSAAVEHQQQVVFSHERQLKEIRRALHADDKQD